MAKFDRLSVLNAMLDTGLVPVFYNPDPEIAFNIARACLEGGARCLEFTNRGDMAWRVLGGLWDRLGESHPQAILGAGSVGDAPTAALYLNSGANFIVGPNLNPEVARLCNRRQVAYSPGCGSVSEITQAQELGVEIVKIFPGGQVGGPAFVKAVKGPLPWTRFMPTGGVAPTEENVGAWISAGAEVLGMGSKLVSKDLVAQGDWAGISQRVKDCLELIARARK